MVRSGYPQWSSAAYEAAEPEELEDVLAGALEELESLEAPAEVVAGVLAGVAPPESADPLDAVDFAESAVLRLSLR